MANNDLEQSEYEVTQAREIGGVYRAVGEKITLTPAQAKYYTLPYGTGLTRVAAKATSRSKALSSDGAQDADRDDV